MKTINHGNVWYGYTWETIFKYLPTKEHNPHKAWWIEKIYINSDNLLDDNEYFTGYRLNCEEGVKNKIPKKFNDFIKNTFKDARYITELKESVA